MSTSSWPPGAPPFAHLVRAYSRLIHRTASEGGVPPRDVPDCAQEVLFRLYRGIVEGRVDAARPLGGWLIRTTASVARDRLTTAHARHETLTAAGALAEAMDNQDPEERMNEALDVQRVIGLILERMPPEQREVFALSDLHDTPMKDIVAELKIPESTAYGRLEAARRTFRREWEAMRKGDHDAALAPLVMLDAHALLAAELAVPGPPRGFADDLLRRLGEQLGTDFLGPDGGASETSGPASGSVRPGTRAMPGAGTKPRGTVTLKVWQIGVGILLAMLAGAGLYAVLRPEERAPSPVAAVLLRDPSVAAEVSTTARSAADDVAAVAPPRTPAEETSAAPPSLKSQMALLDSARALIEGHQTAPALALLERVTAPDLVVERDMLRRRARAEQEGRPTPPGSEQRPR